MLCEANASLSSQRPTSEVCSPCCASSLGTASAGPMPISRGAHPVVTADTNRPMMLPASPSSSARWRVVSSVAAAPSDTCDELPAVDAPSAAKTGFSLAIFSRLMLPRTPSSRVTSMICASPTLLPALSTSWNGVVTETISASKAPDSWARAARRCDCTAKASWSARETPLPLAATISDVVPMGMMQSLTSGSADSFRVGHRSTGMARLP